MKEKSASYQLSQLDQLENDEDSSAGNIASLDHTMQLMADYLPIEAWRSLIDLFPGPAYVRSRSGQFIVGNNELAQFVGAPSVNTLLGVELELLSEQYPTTAVLWQQDLQTLRNGIKTTLDEEYLLPGKERRVLRTNKTPFCRMGLTESESVISVSFDVTDNKSFEKQLKDYDNYDSLTGLATRSLVRKRLKHAILRNDRLKVEGALLLLNLDKFREVNEIYGHNLGDELLRTVSQAIQLFLPEEGLLARLSADEFALLMPQVANEQQVEDYAKKLIDLFSAPFIVEDKRIIIGLSIGIIFFAKHGKSFEELFKGVDLALDYAKKKGGNSFQIFDPAMNTIIQRKQDIANMLRNAIEADELELYYQPYLAAPNEKVLGMETLLRWNRTDPTKPKISPAEFIPIAEETGLILSIGEWVIYHAFEERKKWENRSQFSDVCLSINISYLQFKQVEFLTIVERALSATGVKPEWIEFEITESTLMDDVDRAIDIMKYLNKLGICLSIDDFGTGYSSLSYLKKFPIHKIKIDRSFIKDVTTDHDSASITKAIISLGHSLGLVVVAEGVETEEQLEFLRVAGCDVIQGFYYSQPIPAIKLDEWLKGYP